MPFDPPLQMIIDAMRAAEAAQDPIDPNDIPAVRRRADETFLLLRHPIPDHVEVAEHSVAVSDGEVRVRTYRPAGLARPSPTLVFIHGGGWMQGTLDTAEVEAGPMVTAVPCFVVSIEYRLAPEHPYPVPFEDCVSAYRWVHDNAGMLGVDASRVAIAGTSAGGNLAAAVCVAARDRGLTMPIVQLLDVPALDLTLTSPSMSDPDCQAGLTGEGVAQYAAQYLNGADPTEPYVSPLLAPDLTGLPPAVVIVAEHDPVRDDGERWVAALHGAGVAASGYRVLTHFHGGWVIPLTITSRLVQDLRAACRLPARWDRLVARCMGPRRAMLTGRGDDLGYGLACQVRRRCRIGMSSVGVSMEGFSR